MANNSHPYSIKLVAITINENDQAEEYELERFNDYLIHERQTDVRQFFNKAKPGVTNVYFEEDDASYLFRLDLIGKDDQMIASKYIDIEDIEGYLTWATSNADRRKNGIQ